MSTHDDMTEIEKMAKFLDCASNFDGSMFEKTAAVLRSQAQRIAEQDEWMGAVRYACALAMGGNTTFIDNDVARAITRMLGRIAELERDRDELDKDWHRVVHERDEWQATAETGVMLRDKDIDEGFNLIEQRTIERCIEEFDSEWIKDRLRAMLKEKPDAE